MTDNNDDVLVKKFFSENRIDVPDDGFSSVSCAVCPTAHGASASVDSGVCRYRTADFLQKQGLLGSCVVLRRHILRYPCPP